MCLPCNLVLFSMDELIKFLKTEYTGRVSSGHRWLIWDGKHKDDGMWVVYERLHSTKKRGKIIPTATLSVAVKVLSADVLTIRHLHRTHLGCQRTGGEEDAT